jgi:cell division protein FtsZ
MIEEKVKFQFSNPASSIIKVAGIGGGGCNAVNHMYESGIRDVDYIVCNTDAQALLNSPVPLKIQLGVTLTEGRGAGNLPERGEEAAIENYDDIKRVLEENTKMLLQQEWEEAQEPEGLLLWRGLPGNSGSSRLQW